MLLVFFSENREYLKPVLESQSLFIRNCWLYTGSFFIPVKIVNIRYVRSDDMRAEDAFVERFIHSEFLYSRNGQCKTVELNFYEKQNVEKFPTTDLLETDCNKVKLDDEFKVHYENDPCDISIKKITACIVNGHHLKKNIYLQIMSFGLSNLIWRVVVTIMNLSNKKNEKLNFFK